MRVPWVLIFNVRALMTVLSLIQMLKSGKQLKCIGPLNAEGKIYTELVKCTDIHIGSHALVIHSVYQGYLTGSLHHEGSVGLDI